MGHAITMTSADSSRRPRPVGDGVPGRIWKTRPTPLGSSVVEQRRNNRLSQVRPLHQLHVPLKHATRRRGGKGRRPCRGFPTALSWEPRQHLPGSCGRPARLVIGSVERRFRMHVWPFSRHRISSETGRSWDGGDPHRKRWREQASTAPKALEHPAGRWCPASIRLCKRRRRIRPC